MTNGPIPTGERLARARELFGFAETLPPESRESWVRAEAANDAGLADYVLELLGAAGTPTAALHAAAAPMPESKTPVPARIGPYEILGVLGQGGQGVVYRALQTETLRREVALKVVRTGAATREVLARFRLERSALAAMSHRCIAKVFDAGGTDHGEAWFAMELIAGAPLTEYCDTHRLTLEERLACFRLLCEGVQHAHGKGIIHRDLKPANVLAITEGDKPLPKILDFGLAKATDAQHLTASLMTADDRIMGTLEYMSPEQASGRVASADARSDIYSLGVILYELATGHLPFPSLLLRHTGLAGAIRMIEQVDPPRPSERFGADPGRAEVAALRGASESSLRRALVDLDWVILRAMAKEPERRYATVAELGDEVSRLLAHEPVRACPPSSLYRLRKFARRHRVQCTAAATVLAALAVGGIGTAVGFLQKGKALADFRLLANVVRLEDGRRAVDTLYPPVPSNVGRMRDWLRDYGDPLARELPALQQTLAELRAKADAATRQGQSAFDDDGERFLHQTLEQLIAELRRFSSEGGELGTVQSMLAEAETIEQRSVSSRAQRWQVAVDAIARSDGFVASKSYAGRALRPQLGLVPIGMDPVSGLWEFLHLRSGAAWSRAASRPDDDEIPIRDPETGRLVLTADHGIVFVLIPAGTFVMGARRGDTPGPNVDGNAEVDESPMREVTLDWFFLAKHETTQAQWMRLGDGVNPSRFAPGNADLERVGRPATWLHPVESVSWVDCSTVARHRGLRLPTEAQWEYAARANTVGVYWFGDDPAGLQARENAPDETARQYAPSYQTYLPWEDGFVVHAPVGSFRPNPFGLHDVLGNVAEWCMDCELPYDVTPRAGDGLRESARDTKVGPRIQRGGAFYEAPISFRCADRMEGKPELGSERTGVRFARAVE